MIVHDLQHLKKLLYGIDNYIRDIMQGYVALHS